MADFFERMKDGFNKGVATVSTGSKTLIEKSKVNNQIKNLEDEKKQLCELLGARVYNFFTTTETDIARSEVESFCNEISARIQAISVQRQRLEELDREMSQVTGNNPGVATPCPCGYVNAPGAKFCAKCGQSLM